MQDLQHTNKSNEIYGIYFAICSTTKRITYIQYTLPPVIPWFHKLSSWINYKFVRKSVTLQDIDDLNLVKAPGRKLFSPCDEGGIFFSYHIIIEKNCKTQSILLFTYLFLIFGSRNHYMKYYFSPLIFALKNHKVLLIFAF